MAVAAQAQLPVARLFTVFPPGGKIGSEVVVAVTGSDLDEVNQLHFSNAGIKAQAREANKFLVSIAGDVAPGVYEARVVGRFGISNPRSFVVGDLPESITPTTNNSPASAAVISLGALVNGRSEGNAASFYKFSAKKGQRILVECSASEIDSRMDAALVLYDAAKKELKHSRNSGLLDFTPAADGEFVVKVYDYLFRGGAEYFYRLAVRTGPHIDFIFPPSGLAGTKGKYMLYGRNLPGGAPAKNVVVDGEPLEQLEVEIELPRKTTAQFSSQQRVADATLDAFEYRLQSPQGISNPILIGFATGPVIAEKQPNDQAGQAQSISAPCEFVGQFFPASDRDWVTFEAKKGDVFWIEVFSQRMELPSDPFVLLQRVSKNEKGEEQISDTKEFADTDSNIGGVEYKAGTRDPSGRFEVDKDGTYRIQIRDLFNTKADPRLVYRLSIRKETPDFRLVAVAQAPPPVNKDAKEALLWTPLLRRGETMPIKVMAFRRDNFNSDIDLMVENLPVGVTCNEAKVEKDKSVAMLMLTASEGAVTWAGPIKIVGKSKIGEAEVTHAARGATINWAVGDYNNEAIESRLSRDLALAVSGVEAAPISIEPSESKVWEAPAGGKLKIPLKLTRQGEFNGNLKLKATGITALDKLKEIDADGKSTNTTIEIDLAEYKIPEGRHSFYLQTQTPGKYRNNPEAAKEAEEALKQAEKLVTDRTAAIKATQEAKQSAAKTAAESVAKAKVAWEGISGAQKNAAETESTYRAAAEKLAAARTLWEENLGDPDLRDGKDSAVKAFDEAEAKFKAAFDAKALAKKAAEDAQAKADSDTKAQGAAEKAEAEAPAKLKEAEKSKEVAAQRAKNTAEVAKPRDVTITVYSAPINLKITPK